jgi:hypothetical protein
LSKPPTLFSTISPLPVGSRYPAYSLTQRDVDLQKLPPPSNSISSGPPDSGTCVQSSSTPISRDHVGYKRGPPLSDWAAVLKPFHKHINSLDDKNPLLPNFDPTPEELAAPHYDPSFLSDTLAWLEGGGDPAHPKEELLIVGFYSEKLGKIVEKSDLSINLGQVFVEQVGETVAGVSKSVALYSLIECSMPDGTTIILPPKASLFISQGIVIPLLPSIPTELTQILLQPLDFRLMEPSARIST